MVLRWLRVLAGVTLIVLGVLFALAFEARYWRWRDCFNDLGRCYDPKSQEVFLEQASIVWGGLTLVCFAIALVLLVLIRRR